MRQEEEFYITLPSNVKSISTEKPNSISNYRTKLKRRIDLQSNQIWKVGLAEITYTKSWYNVREEKHVEMFFTEGLNANSMYNGIFYQIPLDKDDKEKPIDKTISNIEENDKAYKRSLLAINVKAGYFQNIESLCYYLNNNFLTLSSLCEECPVIKYDNITNKCIMFAGKYENSAFFPDLGEELEQILGFINENELSLRKREFQNFNDLLSGAEHSYIEMYDAFNSQHYTGKYCSEMNAGCQSLFVYTNIVDHTLVGDASAQLLRIVEIPNDKQFSENITIKYNKPHFIPLQTNSLDIINLDIRDDTFKPIPFKFGRVSIKLIFKKYD